MFASAANWHLSAARPPSSSLWILRASVQQILAKPTRPSRVARSFNSMLPGASRAQEDEGKVLLEELPGGLKLMQQRLALDHLDLQLIVPHDVDAVMDMYINAGREDLDPYWARPWPSAAALAEKIIAQPQLVRGCRVCDLGAGLGIAGMAAALAGAHEVVLLDREPLALRCALLSAAASGLTSPATLLVAGAHASHGSAAGMGSGNQHHSQHASDGQHMSPSAPFDAEIASSSETLTSSSSHITESAQDWSTMNDGPTIQPQNSPSSSSSSSKQEQPRHANTNGESALGADLETQSGSARRYQHRHRRRQHLQHASSSLYDAGASSAAPSPPPTSGWPRPKSRHNQQAASPDQVLPAAEPTQPEDNGSCIGTAMPQATSLSMHGQPDQNGIQEAKSSSCCQISAQVFDWADPPALAPFDVILACDVLYEDFSVEPLAGLVLELLSNQPDARVLLADPVNRTPHNRQRFLELLAANKRGGLALNVEEASQVDFMFKGSSQDGLRNPVVLTTLRRGTGGDTVGVPMG